MQREMQATPETQPQVSIDLAAEFWEFNFFFLPFSAYSSLRYIVYIYIYVSSISSRNCENRSIHFKHKINQHARLIAAERSAHQMYLPDTFSSVSVSSATARPLRFPLY